MLCSASRRKQQTNVLTCNSHSPCKALCRCCVVTHVDDNYLCMQPAGVISIYALLASSLIWQRSLQTAAEHLEGRPPHTWSTAHLVILLCSCHQCHRHVRERWHALRRDDTSFIPDKLQLLPLCLQFCCNKSQHTAQPNTAWHGIAGHGTARHDLVHITASHADSSQGTQAQVKSPRNTYSCPAKQAVPLGKSACYITNITQRNCRNVQHADKRLQLLVQTTICMNTPNN